jgi:hypothetical protein
MRFSSNETLNDVGGAASYFAASARRTGGQ